ncbi:MAG: tripartite tricarboxylate transporter substrate binding protein [Betaproteobacteria bacterium]|jgi:tripartite-type tricarboxylate transporter receptor subunit TctC|nr:tripartite tricarboxylate transporter substrate binding protein [Betaproteobacteria bacterium]
MGAGTLKFPIATAATALLSAAAVPASLAQPAAGAFPAKPLRIISPYSPGGLGDSFPRAVAVGLAESLGQQVIVENRPGASQVIGMQAAAKAPPDGYTMVFGSVTSLAINPAVNRELPDDPVKDFAPLSLCVTTPLYLVVHPSVPVATVKDLVALARRQPGRLTFASGGNGSSNHLAGELLKLLAGIDMIHVPYKGAGPAMADVMGGHVDLMLGAAGLSEARAGRVRVLGVTSARRAVAAPDIPTLQEAGVAGYESTIWFGLLATGGTPAPIVDRLSRDIRKVLQQPSVQKAFSTVEITPTTPEAFAAHIQSEMQKWRKVINRAKIVME